MALSSVSPHYQCLDLLQIDRGSSVDPCDEAVVMLEVWESGATLHSGTAIAPGAAISLMMDSGRVPAHVVKCSRDYEFGFVVDIDIDAPEKWFRAENLPAWRLDNKPDTKAATDFAHYA